jgi:hypothetical protein
MSNSFELPPDTRTVLTGKRQLHPDTVVLVEMVMEELIEVAAGVGRDYDEAEGDYANLAGLMCSGRTRNRVARRIRSGETPDGSELQAVGSASAIVLRGGGTWVHPYSSGSSDAPLLAGSVTKDLILEEGMEQLVFFEKLGEEGPPRHIVIAYARDLEGVLSAKIGVMSGREEFAWEEPIYARAEDTDEGIDIQDEPEPNGPSHDEQHVPDPDVKLRPRRDERDDEL